jgi:adenylate cyclase
MKDFLQSIADDAKDIFGHEIETTKTYSVPGRNDAGLTFGRDQVKRGKLIETCVLFIDIRNSTGMSRSLKKDKARLGKIYSAFVDAMVSIADKYGYVRNIIGDRVMVVFEPGNCFVDAVDCAVAMYTVATKILKKFSGLDSFKVGIGIDWGEMLILKTGIQKRHEEQSEYKNLVWVGDAANSASKLTDFANKEYNSPVYKITYQWIETERYFKGFKTSPDSLANLYLGIAPKSEPEYGWRSVTKSGTDTISANDFHTKIKFADEVQYNGRKVTHIDRVEQSGTTSSILMSGKVFDEFKKAQPKSSYLKNFSKAGYPNAPYTGTGIYAGSAMLSEITQINF